VTDAEQAVSKKKLFVVDHHDVYLPLVESINARPNRKTYATRTLLFLSSDQTLKVLAIELVLPGSGGGKKKARVFTPPADSSKTDYVWELAKAHIMSNEMAVHQVTSHLLVLHYDRLRRFRSSELASLGETMFFKHPSLILGAWLFVLQWAKPRNDGASDYCDIPSAEQAAPDSPTHGAAFQVHAKNQRHGATGLDLCRGSVRGHIHSRGELSGFGCLLLQRRVGFRVAGAAERPPEEVELIVSLHNFSGFEC
jgi:hypothetical protein